MTGTKITLIGSEGRVFIVEQNVAKISDVLKFEVENPDNAEDNDDDIIPLQIADDTLEMVLKWMEYEYKRRRVGCTGGVKDQNFKLGKNFWNVDLECLNAIVKAAIYLDIVGLCETARSLIKKKLTEKLDPQLHRILVSSGRRN